MPPCSTGLAEPTPSPARGRSGDTPQLHPQAELPAMRKKNKHSAEAKSPERITGFSESPPAPSSFNTSAVPRSWEDIYFKNTCVGIIKSAKAKQS